ncbi:hypothetical protein KP509_20G046800 [Ceratopteris richardii]|uniref:Cyclin-like domain-containing protein n=1 Tax=Ceratopteris richardii TaxID=49495 RepID=A0A8T2SEY6_CERRI|nr:hypothetical protein KP509_20G046800 [Ceratopteris richardii]KAH7331697.1 hypothetical protein KP509_20G046800 [Ceratopteris richardii]
MAANFWTSSHYRTLHDEEKVGHVLPADGQRGLTEEDIKVIKISMSQYIKSLAQQAKVRHRVVATAITYFRRVYTRKSFSEFDPCLVAPTCLYLASKAEESTVPAKHLIYYMKKTYQDDKGSFEVKDVLEMEMKLLEALDYYLVVYHPYRPLVRFLQDAGLNELIQDACVLKEKDTISWFEDLRIDLNMLKNICMVMLDFYDNYQHVELLDDRVHVALNKIRQR